MPQYKQVSQRCIVVWVMVAGVGSACAHGQCSPEFTVEIVDAPESCIGGNPRPSTHAISGNGNVCGTTADCNDGGPYGWFGEPPVIRIQMPATHPLGQGYGVNSNQQVVGSMHNSIGNTDFKGFLYHDGQLTPLEPLSNHHSAISFRINDEGIACGHSQSTSTGQMLAVVWKSFTPVALQLPHGPNSEAHDITGNLVCGWMGDFLTSNSTSRAFIHDLGTGKTIDVGTPLPGTINAQAKAVNTFGNICGQSAVSCGTGCVDHRGFLWSSNAAYDLGELPDHPRCQPLDLNDSNTVVGRCTKQSGVAQAFVWQDGVIYRLHDLIPQELNMRLEHATGINNAGQIAAYGFIVGGPNVAVRLNPIPSVSGDVDCNRIVNVADILGVVNSWGDCPPQFTAPCNADFNEDQRVGVPDLLSVINHWSP